MKNSDECREAFEKWAISEGYDTSQEPDENGFVYVDMFLEVAWLAWKSCWNRRQEVGTVAMPSQEAKPLDGKGCGTCLHHEGNGECGMHPWKCDGITRWEAKPLTVEQIAELMTQGFEPSMWENNEVVTYCGGSIGDFVAAAKRIHAAMPRTPSREDAEFCEWKQWDYEGDTWESSCGQAWSFIDGGPEENGVIFCHHCGKRVKITAKNLQVDEDE